MKVNTDCDVCQFAFICPNKFSDVRLPHKEGGLGFCPKLWDIYRMDCWDCIFRNRVNRDGGAVYVCRAMANSKLAPGGSVPVKKPKDCPLLLAKEEASDVCETSKAKVGK